MNAPGTPQPPKPSLKLKVPGSTTGGPKLGGGPRPAVPTAPPPSLPGALAPVAAPPAVPGALPTPGPIAPPPSLGAASPPPVASPALPVPGAAPAPPVPGSAPAAPIAPPPSVPSPMTTETQLGQTEEDAGEKNAKPKKGKKTKVKGPAEPKVKAKPSIFFLVVDFLIFGGAVALSVLVFIKS